MYAAMVDYRVETGRLEGEVRVWRERVEPVSARQPGFQGSLLSTELQKYVRAGFGLWSSEAHADEFATVGPWKGARSWGVRSSNISPVSL